MPRFSHVHFHIVPRAADLPAELRGGRVFAFLKAPPAEVIAPELVAEFCTRVSNRVRQPALLSGTSAGRHHEFLPGQRGRFAVCEVIERADRIESEFG